METADVFLTNLRTSARVKLGIEPADLMKLNPRLVYDRGAVVDHALYSMGT